MKLAMARPAPPRPAPALALGCVTSFRSGAGGWLRLIPRPLWAASVLAAGRSCRAPESRSGSDLGETELVGIRVGVRMRLGRTAPQMAQRRASAALRSACTARPLAW